MEVSVTSLKGLERRVEISLPAEQVDPRVKSKLSELSGKVRMKGFRRNKVPVAIVQERYGSSVHHDVAFEMMEKALQEVLRDKALTPAGQPKVDEMHIKLGEPVKFVISFEEYPKIDLADLGKISVEKLKAKIETQDVNKRLQQIQRQHAEWKVVDRPAKEGDGVLIDFDGKIKGEPFKGGSAKKMFVVLGDGAMLADFEKGLMGATAGKPLEIKMKFPKDYVKELAGKKAVFEIKVHEVKEAELPEINADFAKKLGIEQGTVAVLREEVRKALEIELERIANGRLRKQIIESLIAKHKIEVPKVMVTAEAERLDRMAGRATAEKDMDEETLKRATRNVTQVLIFRALIDHYKIELDDARVREYVNSLAMPGQDTDEVMQLISSNQDQLTRVKNDVLEAQVIDKVLQEVRVSEKVLSWDDAMKASVEA